MTTIDVTADASRLWNHVYGDLTGYLCAFTARRAEPSAQNLQRQIERFFTYPIAAENAVAWLFEQDERGFEAYFCAHLLTDRRRIKGNAAEILTLWADGDRATIPEGFPKPSAIVESSPGRHHYYWRLTHPIPPGTAESLNRRIAYAIGADKSGWDLGQLLRPPGTHNHKYVDAIVKGGAG
jgi:RepB DNA-primase from phage plasmid